MSLLLDVLPCRPSAAAERPQRIGFPLDAGVVAGLRARDAKPERALHEALARVESRLTGAGDEAQAGAQPVWAVAGDESAAGALSRWKLDMRRRRLEAEFDAPLTGEAVEILAACARRVLAELAAGAGAATDGIDVLDPAERERILVEWNRDPAAGREYGSVHARFAEVRASRPNAPAVVDANVALTYAELDARAAALAGRLRAAGVAPGDLVGVAMRRSADAIVALLGILKAGAAYLPLDTALPESRLAFMLADAGVRVVVVDDPGAPDPLPRDSVRVAANAADGAPPANDVARGGGDLAYVMFTSGSTGEPKGVEIQHRAILCRVCDLDYISMVADTRVLHVVPLGFDPSTLEIWGALLNGGTVVVHHETMPSGAALRETVRRHRVQWAVMSVALFNAIVDDDPEIFASLREIVIGGEAPSVDHLRRMFAAAPGIRLHNAYGPTECTILTHDYPVPNDLAADAGPVPMGRAVPATRAYVLNARREPVPAGVAGELYIGGAGVARGYRNRPQLTAERFVPNPFGPAGDVLYRTGDLVRHRADGALEFIGRNDSQVKIRGFRIELGEIEALLVRHPAVRSCAVVARDDPPGEKRLVAYYVPAGDGVGAPQLRAHLAATLPHFMVPTRYVALDELPLTANGKLDRRALPAPDRNRPELAGDYAPPATPLERRICDAIGALLDVDGVGRDDNFFELGGSSLLAVRLAEQLRSLEGAQSGGGRGIDATTVFRHPTAAGLAAALSGAKATEIDSARIARARRGGGAEPVAIVAMAGRFPGAADVEAFWRNLCEGRDSISVFAPDELDPSIPAAERNDPAYVPARGVIDGADRFDAAFFGIGGREAELMDPQQRLFLELCWECLERGGHAPDATNVPVGVFAGMNNGTYYQRHVATRPDLVAKAGSLAAVIGNEKDYIATRVAHKLNLTGPAISIHTACSTSLVAICQAVDSLQAGNCDMALAGGVAVTCPPRSGYLYQEGAMLSPDGRTRAFDANAQGTVFCDGAAVLLLKRLSDAIADGNTVYATIRAGAVNNDGGHRASFTAPTSDGQAAVIAMAQDKAGVDPRSIDYVETHGTATPLGDPIEIEGLTKAFRRGTADTGFCRIGSLKSNVGHLVTAAGAAGVIKTALALHEERIPASLHFDAPNPAIDFANSPFVVNAAISAWKKSDAAPRRAGVSSFGVGGTNAHAILEEAPALPASEPAQGPQLLVLSARTPAALESAVERLAAHLEAHPDENLADVAWTLAAGRKAFAHRVAAAADDVAAAVAALRDPDTRARAARSRPARAGEAVFLFPGQGATYAGMGRGLYAGEPAFREAIDECARVLQDELGFDLREKMFADDAQALLPTSVMQPATFAIEYALAIWWMSRGVVPAAMIGHSVGEFVAATIAGVFELADALRLVARRGALMQAQPAGAMLSVRQPAAAVLSRLNEELSLAAENSPSACVVAGPEEAIAKLQAQLEGEGIACRPLRTSHAFHSAMMEPVVAPFRESVAALDLREPAIPVMSTVNAAWLDAATAKSPDYWARHLREPVRFAPALAALLETSPRALLEVGPRASLGALARQQPETAKQGVAVVASLADDPAAEARSLRSAAGQLWSHGVALDPAAFDRRAVRRRVRLPTYPFERQRYWIEAAPVAASNVVPHPAIAAKLEPVMPQALPSSAATAAADNGRRVRLVGELRELIESVAGFDMADADPAANFIELGLDSLMLTQVALQLQKTYPVRITFRQLMAECPNLRALAECIDGQLPAEAAPAPAAPAVQAPAQPMPVQQAVAFAAPAALPALDAGGDFARQLIAQQMQLMSQQLALLSGGAVQAAPAAAVPVQAAPVAPPPAVAPAPAAAAPAPAAAEDDAGQVQAKYDVKKAFGAIARIDNSNDFGLSPQQRAKFDRFVERYVARTRKSKEYTIAHRPRLADPRVVNGFRPLTKEIVYQIVVERSKGAHVYDIDGNDYVDALNGFGMSYFGWQPDFIVDAVREQLDKGYEIGPQHPLAGEVAQLVCEITGQERAALCNTGSEAVLGAIRIARTTTARSLIVLFSGSYHGINDEVIVRALRNGKAAPAAPGILRNTAENVLVLDYGEAAALETIRQRAGEIAAVLVEPVQSRRMDLQPREFLQELRRITEDAGALLVFDEVVTGFRSHPGGAQAIFGVRADVTTYGKVVGGGFPIGVIAGKRQYMDALDGGQWEYGDASVPPAGVTYFAGTFVRHPLALAAARAALLRFKNEGAAMQERLNARTTAMAEEIGAFCAEVGAPVYVKHFASAWKTFFTEDHPLQDLLFAMMRSRGIHILDNFPCFLTTAHSDEDIAKIVKAFKESVLEMQDLEFLPRRAVTPKTAMDAARPAVPGARLGREPDGTPAWFVPNPEQPGKYMKVSA